MNLNKKVIQWQVAGLITEQERKKILEFETSKTGSKLNFALMVLSAFFISIGIIALIAANWNFIHPTIKLSGDFVLLSLLAYSVYYAYGKNKFKLYDIASFVFALMVLASIGLITQIYQLQSDSHLVFLIYTLLIFPLVCFSRAALLALFWVPAFLYCFIEYIIEFASVKDFIDKVLASFPQSLSMIIVFLLIVAYQTLRIALPYRLNGLVRALKFWSVFFLIVLFVVIDFVNTNNYLFHQNGLADGLLGILCLSVLISLGLGYKQGQNYFPAFFMFLVLISIFFDFTFIITIIALAGICVYAYKFHRPRLLNFSIFLIGLRIFILYIDTIFALTSFGLALISSGVIMLLTTYGWIKLSAYYKRKLNYEQ